MCYYNGIKIKLNDFIRILEIEKQFQLAETGSILQSGFDYALWPVIKPTAHCDWEIVSMEWGFIPFYLKTRADVKKFREGYSDDNGKFHKHITTLNAIGEEILKPGKMFREAALKRRCIVLSSGFYEWRHIHPIGKSGKVLKTAVKYPYHISPKNNEHFFMAGVYQPWTDKETGEHIDTFAIVTTKANSIMDQIHNSKKRMPVILTEALAGLWISDGLDEEGIQELATYQLPSEELKAYTINKDFRNSDDPLVPGHYDVPSLSYDSDISTGLLF